jgi:hypothetical protein
MDQNHAVAAAEIARQARERLVVLREEVNELQNKFARAAFKSGGDPGALPLRQAEQALEAKRRELELAQIAVDQSGAMIAEATAEDQRIARAEKHAEARALAPDRADACARADAAVDALAAALADVVKLDGEIASRVLGGSAFAHAAAENLLSSASHRLRPFFVTTGGKPALPEPNPSLARSIAELDAQLCREHGLT